MSYLSSHSAIIVDDDKMSRIHLSHLLHKVKGINLRHAFSDPVEAMDFLASEKTDLVFLDIEMPEVSGMDLLQNLRERPLVIITSSKENYALQAFGEDVCDYLAKPVLMPRLIKALEKARKQLLSIAETKAQVYPTHLFFKENKRLIRIETGDILYVESLGDYAKFFLENKRKVVVHSSLKNIEKQLNPDKFLKVHRSFLVNLQKIVDIEDSTLLIEDRVIPISRAQKAPLMQRIQII